MLLYYTVSSKSIFNMERLVYSLIVSKIKQQIHAITTSTILWDQPKSMGGSHI